MKRFGRVLASIRLAIAPRARRKTGSEAAGDDTFIAKQAVRTYPDSNTHKSLTAVQLPGNKLTLVVAESAHARKGMRPHQQTINSWRPTCTF